MPHAGSSPASAAKNSVEALFVGENDGMERDLVTREGVSFTAIQAGALNGVGPVKAVRGVFRMARGAGSAIGLLRQFKPDAVLLTGGFVGVPVALAARALRIPSVVYLPDIEPGMALKAMARFATKIATTTDASAAYVPVDKMVVTGYPVREAFAGLTREQARAALDLNSDDKVILVFGGSKGAQSINTAIAAGITQLTKRAIVLQVTGAHSYDAVAAQYAAAPPEIQTRWRVFKYLHEEMAAAMAAADLAICRSGASSLGELPYVGLPAILIPYPYAWRYQKVNAQYLVDKGAAELLVDAALGESLVTRVSELLDNTHTLGAMRAAMAALARHDGAERIAAVVKEVIHD
jgi:UDP-N-acetylglucosamine--N-acetylmuramyl-(pentapeptide) pyrophosphoryl-undecaprenol N-acetylglucosamine transferase